MMLECSSCFKSKHHKFGPHHWCRSYLYSLYCPDWMNRSHNKYILILPPLIFFRHFPLLGQGNLDIPKKLGISLICILFQSTNKINFQNF